MHLLNVQPGTIDDGSEAVDIAQSPADIVFLSAADTELATLAAAHQRLGREAPASLRVANLLHLKHPMSVDVYVAQTVSAARIVILRLLGGVSYWPYGVEELARVARETGLKLVALPGDDKPDPELARLSTVPEDARAALWRYFVEGGAANAEGALAYAAHLIGRGKEPPPARPLLAAGLYWPGLDAPSLDDVREQWTPARPCAAITFYRALVQSGQTATIDTLVDALHDAGLNALPVYAQSLKDPIAAETVTRLLDQADPAAVVNCTGFALSKPGATHQPTVLDAGGRPVLQAILAGINREAWAESSRGLGARDIAMNVALPEVDGRIITRAVAFKAEAEFDAATEAPIVVHRPEPDRVRFVASQAAAWADLAATPPAHKRVALILANYPNRDGRIGNGVGLDTPASVANLIEALAEAGYAVGDAPRDGAALMDLLLAGPTNRPSESAAFSTGEALDLYAYRTFFDALPDAVRGAIIERWGEPDADQFFTGDAFRLPLHRFGNAVIGIQPARGYNIDPKTTYHDPDLVPPHGYVAFHAWLRSVFETQAVLQVGKHGNLEWLPGKGLALSEACYPEALLGPVPLIYPFIVNDPGEGAQAKRRASAVIVDHLTPPLARAETYGPLRDLEALVDEYFEAAQVDARRAEHVKRDILDHARATGLDADCGIDPKDADEDALARLDAHLCDLKEMQIRDGLHVLGSAPDGDRLTGLLVALARVPRGTGVDGDASMHRALAEDLGLGFDPLTRDLARPWTGPRPAALADLSADPWRTAGDTVERLELLAHTLVDGAQRLEPDWHRTRSVLDTIGIRFRSDIGASGDAEIDGVLRALDGAFVPPGPSGAPTRGRPEVLPTGRNFYSVDSRAVPTPAAFDLGRKSADLLVEDYRQREGAWPKAFALSAWGTANMRTGGDDIAQALALGGVKPKWEPSSGRITGFDILPVAALGRPRVDVTLRVSGFFRDAFPAQIDLVDSALRAVGALDEPASDNPIAARMREDTARLTAAGLPQDAAARRAGFRVFSSMPGAYGAGLQALIDERLWETRDDFADAYVAWSGFAYGQGAEGEKLPDLLMNRLAATDAVVHNQDNREHDLLDSDDYYQFEGGLAAAVEKAAGTRPIVYHNDHSRPETPVVRTLEDEIARVVRARAANPKWIAGAMRHGYKGAFEIAATVDYLFAFQATTGAVKDHHFDLLFDAYLGDDDVRDFVAEANAPALLEIAARFREALDRGLWRPRLNAVYDVLDRIEGETA